MPEQTETHEPDFYEGAGPGLRTWGPRIAAVSGVVAFVVMILLVR